MEIQLSQALGPVKIAMMDVAARASSRRLQMYGESIPCKPGCFACCKRLVTVTVAEAVLIYEHLLSRGLWAGVKEEARAQFPLVKDANPLAWFKTGRTCPVLDKTTGLCKSYELRPAGCAAHYVTSNPDLCDPWSVANGEYQPVDMDDLVTRFQKRLLENVDGFGILRLELGLPVALLLAERISIQTGMDLDKAVALLWNELA